MGKSKGRISSTELKHKAFALEFLKDFNATRAYKEIYKCSQRVAEVNGTKLLGNTRVQTILQEPIKQTMEKKLLTAEFVLDGLIEVVNKCLQKEPIKKTIKKIKLDDEGNETIEMETVDSIGDFIPKEANNAFDKLGKYLKLRSDAANLNFDVDIIKVGKKK